MILYHAGWVLPVSQRPIRNGTVGVDGGRLTWVGARAAAPSGDDVDLGDCLLLPGLVNAHTHLDLSVLRGFLDGLPFFSWVRTLTAARREVLSDIDLLESARSGIRAGLLAGITTFGDTSPGDAAFCAMKELGVRGIAYREVFGPDPAQCEASMIELRQAIRLMRAEETALVSAGVSPHAPYSVSDDLFRATAALAREERLPLATHIAESDDESRLVEHGVGPFAEFLRGRGIDVAPRARSPLDLLDRCGVLDADPLLIHCVRMDARDIDSVGRRRLAVAHCPASNAWFGHGAAPVGELLDAGARVGLGSDSMASNSAMDLLAEARLVVDGQRRRGRGDFGAADALALATLGSARAMGLDGTIGSLEVGKAADLVAFLAPRDVGDPEATLLAGPASPPVLVLVAGREVVRHGVVRPADAELPARVAAAARRLEIWKRQGPRDAAAHPAP